MTPACFLAVPWGNASNIIKILLCCLTSSKHVIECKKKKEVPELSGICFKIVQENVGKETDEKMLLIIEVGGWVSWDALLLFSFLL